MFHVHKGEKKEKTLDTAVVLQQSQKHMKHIKVAVSNAERS